jgi:hypothetical protein
MPNTPFEKRRKASKSANSPPIGTKLRGYWLTLRLTIALWRGNLARAKQILFQLKRTIRPLPHFAQWFDHLQQDRPPRVTLAPTLKGDAYFIADRQAVREITQRFQLLERDPGLIQCTGIDDRVFSALEACLSDFVRTAFETRKRQNPARFADELHRAIVDLDGLKRGIDPNYSSPQTPYVYLTQYLLDNTYSAYLAWFWVYQRGLLSAKFSVLDLAAGPGTVAFGLSLLLQSLGQTITLPELHIRYTSIEQQDHLQFRGLQFWRYFSTEAAVRLRPIGLFFQFHTFDLFQYVERSHLLPDQRFDFLTISHCFFADADRYEQSMVIYRQIIRDRLAPHGTVMLIIQWSKIPGRSRDCSVETERELLRRFVEQDLGLELEWCRYLTSTGQRGKLDDFGAFAREHCPAQGNISGVAHDYLDANWVSHYAIDDYIILARQA